MSAGKASPTDTEVVTVDAAVAREGLLVFHLEAIIAQSDWRVGGLRI